MVINVTSYFPSALRLESKVDFWSLLGIKSDLLVEKHDVRKPNMLRWHVKHFHSSIIRRIPFHFVIHPFLLQPNIRCHHLIFKVDIDQLRQFQAQFDGQFLCIVLDRPDKPVVVAEQVVIKPFGVWVTQAWNAMNDDEST